MSKPLWLAHLRKNFEQRRQRPKKCLRVGLHREIDAPYDGCSSKICNKSGTRAGGVFNRLPPRTVLKREQPLANLGACGKVAPADTVEDPLEASPLCSKVALADSVQVGPVFVFQKKNQRGKRTEGHKHSITHTNLRRSLPRNFNIERLGADLDRFSVGDGGTTPSRTQC